VPFDNMSLFIEQVHIYADCTQHDVLQERQIVCLQVSVGLKDNMQRS